MFRRSTSINKNDHKPSDTYYNQALADLCDLLNQIERYVEAEEALNKACCFNEIDASVYYCLRKATGNQHRVDEAIEHYKKCCQLETHNTYLLDISYA